MKILLLSLMVYTLTVPAYAEDSIVSIPVSPAILSGDVQVSVNGLVCDFCARALEKVFGAQEAVKNIHVNLDTKIITIHFKEGQSLDDVMVKQLINDAGYDVEVIHRAR